MAATNGARHAHSRPKAELEATLGIVPTYGRYALASGALTFVNGDRRFLVLPNIILYGFVERGSI